MGGHSYEPEGNNNPSNRGDSPNSGGGASGEGGVPSPGLPPADVGSLGNYNKVIVEIIQEFNLTPVPVIRADGTRPPLGFLFDGDQVFTNSLWGIMMEFKAGAGDPPSVVCVHLRLLLKPELALDEAQGEESKLRRLLAEYVDITKSSDHPLTIRLEHTPAMITPAIKAFFETIHKNTGLTPEQSPVEALTVFNSMESISQRAIRDLERIILETSQPQRGAQPSSSIEPLGYVTGDLMKALGRIVSFAMSNHQRVVGDLTDTAHIFSLLLDTIPQCRGGDPDAQIIKKLTNLSDELYALNKLDEMVGLVTLVYLRHRELLSFSCQLGSIKRCEETSGYYALLREAVNRVSIIADDSTDKAAQREVLKILAVLEAEWQLFLENDRKLGTQIDGEPHRLPSSMQLNKIALTVAIRSRNGAENDISKDCEGLIKYLKDNKMSIEADLVLYASMLNTYQSEVKQLVETYQKSFDEPEPSSSDLQSILAQVRASITSKSGTPGTSEVVDLKKLVNKLAGELARELKVTTYDYEAGVVG